MEPDAQQALERLEERGVGLIRANRALGAEQIENRLHISLGAEFHEFYSVFAGFTMPDPRSHIRLWGVDELISRNINRDTLALNSTLMIGDFLIESDEISVDTENESTIWLVQERRFFAKGFF